MPKLDPFHDPDDEIFTELSKVSRAQHQNAIKFYLRSLFYRYAKLV